MICVRRSWRHNVPLCCMLMCVRLGFCVRIAAAAERAAAPAGGKPACGVRRGAPREPDARRGRTWWSRGRRAALLAAPRRRNRTGAMQKQGRGGISSDPVSRTTADFYTSLVSERSPRNATVCPISRVASRLQSAFGGVSFSSGLARGRRLGLLRPRSCVSRKEAPKVLSARRAWSTSCLWPL